MKNIYFVVLFFLFLSLYATEFDAYEREYLDNYFGELEYSLHDNSLIANGRTFRFVVHYIAQNIFDKAVIYEKKDSEIITHLKVSELVFWNSNEFKIENFKHVKLLRGFSYTVRQIDDFDFPLFFTFDGHFDDELYTSDSFYIEWDEKRGCFMPYYLNMDEL